MFRSPLALRSGSKVSRVKLSDQDKSKVVRSLSDPSSPSSEMAAKQIKPTDSAAIEECVNKYLGRTDVFEGLVARLKVAVEDAVRVALTAANLEIARLKEEVTQLRGEMRKMEEVRLDRMDDLEQYTRRTNLRVYGIPEVEKEDTDRHIVQLCQDRLGVDLAVAAISRSHRLGQRNPPAPDGKARPRPIIVRFVSYRDRRLVYEAKKKLKGSSVVLKEDLTARRHEVYRRAVEQFGLRRCWTNDGRVCWVDKDGRKGSGSRLVDIDK